MGWSDDYLEHHGILGQKWGVRRFENKNGHLTPAGQKRYEDGRKVTEKEKHAFSAKAAGHKALANVYGMNAKVYSKSNKTLSSMNKAAKTEQLKKAEQAQKEADAKKAEKDANKKGLSDKQKKMIIAGAAVVGTAVAAYGGYKLYQKSVQTRAQAHLLATGMSTVNKEIAKESKTKINAINDYYHAVSNNGRTKDGGLLVDPKAYKDHWTGVADRHIGELNNQYEELRKNAANIGSDYKKSKAYLNSVKNRTNKHEDFIDVSNRARAISSMGKPKKQTQTSDKAVSNAKSALNEFKTLQSNLNKPTFSKSTQNGPTKEQMTQQKLKAAQESHPKIDRATVSHTPIDRIQIDRATVDRIKVDRTPINMDSFNKAAQANDDLVNSLLKKNAKSLGL